MKTVKVAAAVLLAAIASALAVNRFVNRRMSGEDAAKVWFYDQASRQLYSVPVGTIPPDETRHGGSRPGVRAIVVAFRGEEKDRRKRKIAYLETCSPALKTLLERVHAAHQAGKPFEGNIPSRESAFFQDNTLVRRVDDPDWVPSGSDEGHRILAEWQSWRGPDGARPVVCVP